MWRRENYCGKRGRQGRGGEVTRREQMKRGRKKSSGRRTMYCSTRKGEKV
jgi:hypothetical protein